MSEITKQELLEYWSISANERKDYYQLGDVLVHKTAVIEEGADIREKVRIGPHAKIKTRAIIYPNVDIKARVTIGEHSIVDIGAMIQNRVNIGKECSIGKYVMLMPETTVGDGTNIHKLAEIRESTNIGANVVVDTNVQIGNDAEIGDNVEICAEAGTIPAYVKIFKGNRLCRPILTAKYGRVVSPLSIIGESGSGRIQIEDDIATFEEVYHPDTKEWQKESCGVKEWEFIVSVAKMVEYMQKK